MENQLTFLTAFTENFEAQCNSMAALSQTVFSGLTKLIELNISATQTAVIESGAAAKQYLSTAPKEWPALAVIHCQPAAGKTFDYLRHASKIVSETQAELSKAAEVKITESNDKIMTMVDALAQSSAAAGLANTEAPLKKQTAKAGTKSSLSAVA